MFQLLLLFCSIYLSTCLKVEEMQPTSVTLRIEGDPDAAANVKVVAENLEEATPNIERTVTGVPNSVTLDGLDTGVFYGLTGQVVTTKGTTNHNVAVKMGQPMKLSDLVNVETDWQAESVVQVTARKETPPTLRVIMRYSINCTNQAQPKVHTFILHKELIEDQNTFVLGPVQTRYQCHTHTKKIWVQSAVKDVSSISYFALLDQSNVIKSIESSPATFVLTEAKTTTQSTTTNAPEKPPDVIEVQELASGEEPESGGSGSETMYIRTEAPEDAETAWWSVEETTTAPAKVAQAGTSLKLARGDGDRVLPGTMGALISAVVLRMY